MEKNNNINLLIPDFFKRNLNQANNFSKLCYHVF